MQTQAFILFTAQKMKFSIKDSLSKCDQTRRKLQIWSHLLKKSLMKNFISFAVIDKKIRKRILSITVAGITFTNNELKDIMKVNSGILLKGTNKEITSPEGGFVNFLKPLMSVGLALMKIVLKPSTKNVLLPLGLAELMAATDALIQKKISGSERRA